MMPQATKEKSSYAEAFSASRRAGEPSWVAALREQAFARFEAAGFPSTDEEDWKYTNVAPIARASFAPATTLVAPDTIDAPSTADAEGRRQIGRFVYEEARSSRLVFIDGLFVPEFSDLTAVAPGAVVAELTAELAGERAELLRERLGALAGESGNSFAALNTAFFGGAFVYVPRGVRVGAPVQLLFLSTSEASERMAAPRLLVIAERESELDLIESYASADGGAYFTNAVAELFVGDGARVTHCKIQDESDAAFHVASSFAELGRDGFYDLTTMTLGSKLSRHDISVRLSSEGSECFVDGLYIVGEGQHADTHSLIEHLRPHCASRQTYKGILDGKSRAVFNGKVFVHAGAEQTDAQQSNKNLLLSPEARVDTKPQLEIYNDDVKCSHGATVGQLEEEELFYLLSRGLHPALARNLLTYGFAEEVVAKLRHGSIRRQLDEAILNRLHARLEA
jgi:Fe-S cluster assembly protein SufD